MPLSSGSFKAGSEHPRYVGPSSVVCRVCGSEFQVQAKDKTNRSICSPECVVVYRKSHLPLVGIKTRFQKGLTGKKSPHWKGGYLFIKYGITQEEYDEMFRSQNGCCAICGHIMKGVSLNVDHDHKTGKVRGLLCFRCNYGIGWFQENVKRLEAVIEYLNRGEPCH